MKLIEGHGAFSVVYDESVVKVLGYPPREFDDF
jgi:hypothetical protein